MTNDPILAALKIAVRRLALYCLCSALITISLFILVVIVCLDRPAEHFWAYATAAFHPSTQPEVAVVAGLCAVIGCLVVWLAFLYAVVWWRRPRVLHVRGTRLIDTRRGKRR